MSDYQQWKTHVECAVSSCKNIGNVVGKYGYCQLPHVTLKFRLAGDFGKGTIVMLECLQQELPE